LADYLFFSLKQQTTKAHNGVDMMQTKAIKNKTINKKTLNVCGFGMITAANRPNNGMIAL